MVEVSLNKREVELMSGLLSAEIMKLQYYYGNKKPERLESLYGIRDKLIEGSKKDEERT